MSVATSTLATVVVTNSIHQSQNKCFAIMPSYKDAGATNQQKMQYAQCVQMQQPMSRDAENFMKGYVGSTLLAMVFVLFYVWRKEKSFADGLVCCLLAPLAAIFLFMIIAAAAWVIS